MMPKSTATQRALELEAERSLLIKADTDIEEGWGRLRNQQELLTHMQLSGQDTDQAERLLRLLKCTLDEWERHRTLIEQRIAYLQTGGPIG
jgi:hypothetical protein